MQSLDFQTKDSNTLLRKFMASCLFSTWSLSFSLFLTLLLFLLSKSHVGQWISYIFAVVFLFVWGWRLQEMAGLQLSSREDQAGECCSVSLKLVVSGEKQIN